MIKDLCRVIEHDIEPIYTTTNTELTYSMVLQDLGIGYCMVDYLRDNFKISDVCIVNVENVHYPQSILACAVYKQTMTKATKAFVTGLIEFCSGGTKVAQILPRHELTEVS